MSNDGEQFSRIASAEKQLCDQAGPLLAEIIRAVEDRYGVKIAELRVTMDQSGGLYGWSGANCVIVREDEGVSDLRSTPAHWGTKVHQALSKR
jgi:hypothetical protein